MNAWRITSWVCVGVVVASVLACVAIAIVRSRGLVAVVVTAINPADEPVDHILPLVKRHEALPDYELVVLEVDGTSHYLGAKPDQSAAEGLEWRLSDPVSVARIATVRLREKDKVVSDEVAEVPVRGATIASGGYRFDFETERSFGVGVRSFFTTPIGMAISGAFFVAVLVMILSRVGP